MFQIGVDVPPSFDDLERRDADAFLEHLGGVAGESAWNLSADFRHVADARDEADEFALRRRPA